MTNLFSIGRNITQRNKLRRISPEKRTHLGKSCVTTTDLVVTFYKKTELGDVILETISETHNNNNNNNNNKEVLKVQLSRRTGLNPTQCR